MAGKLVYWDVNYNPSNFVFLEMNLLKEPWNRTIDPRAVIIYSYLVSLCKFSLKNGWIDENNNVYVKFSVDEMANLLSINRDTARKFKKQLVDAGLIEIPGEGKSKRPSHAYPIYVKVFKEEQNNIIQLRKNTNNKFNDFQQNEYDMKTLEDKLLDN